MQWCPVRSGQLRHAEEGDFLLGVVEEGAFQDQLVPVRGEPQPLHRAAVQVLAAVAGVTVPASNGGRAAPPLTGSNTKTGIWRAVFSW